MLLVWACGVVACLLILLLDLLALKWMAGRAVQITRGPWLEAFERVRGPMPLPPVMLLERPGPGMPLACGLIAPTLVLPGDVNAWPPDRRRAVIAHELAHVSRHDCATQLFARIACAVHWFNPLAWHAMQRMRVERERACDDLAIGGGTNAARGVDVDRDRGGRGGAAEYAAHLLEVARSLRTARLGALAGVAMARPSQLEGRLLAVLDERNDHRPVGGRFVAASVLTVILAVGSLAAVRVAARDASAPAVYGASAPAVSGAASSIATAPATQPSQASLFPNGQTVEVKWGGIWRKAVVVNHRGEWILVDYNGNRTFREWVEPWRVRTIGSSDDFHGAAPRNPYVRHNEGPPREEPGPAPVAEIPAAPRGARGAHGINGPPAADAEPMAKLPVTPVLRQNVKAVSLDALPPLGALAPDSAPAAAWVTAPLTLGGSSGQFFDRPAALLLSPAACVGAVLHINAPLGKGPPQWRLERFDLKSGRSLNVASLPLEPELLDLSADGKLLLARTGALQPGHGARLDLWQVDGDKAAQVVSFAPFTPRNGGEQVVWARFVGPDHIVARSFDGELSCYALHPPAQVWSAKLRPANGNANALSATGKYLAVSTGDSIAILDPLTGTPLGGIDLSDRPAQSLAFKPDGKQIAVAGQDEVAVWDLAGGSAPVADVWSVGAAGQAVEWGAEGYLLLDQWHLVSLGKQMVIWSYQGVAPAMHGKLAQVCAGRMYYTADAAPTGREHRPVVASVMLPDEAVRGAIAAAGEPLMALKPGVSLTLDVSVDGSIRQQVIGALTAKLKANGVGVAEGQPLKLVAREEPGQTRDITYRRIGFGAFGRTDTIHVQEVKRLVALLGADGKPLWQRGGLVLPPPFLSLKEGQSPEAAVAEAMKPSPRFYESLRIPKLVPEQPDGVGITYLTAAGPQPPKRNPPKLNPPKPNLPKLKPVDAKQA
jgi:beta-lactamase regulating signal transducer with metallopeptidase domain